MTANTGLVEEHLATIRAASEASAGRCRCNDVPWLLAHIDACEGRLAALERVAYIARLVVNKRRWQEAGYDNCVPDDVGALSDALKMLYLKWEE